MKRYLEFKRTQERFLELAKTMPFPVYSVKEEGGRYSVSLKGGSVRYVCDMDPEFFKNRFLPEAEKRGWGKEV